MKNEIIMSYVLPPPSIQVYIQNFVHDLGAGEVTLLLFGKMGVLSCVYSHRGMGW